jgi:hypothetical protein
MPAALLNASSPSHHACAIVEHRLDERLVGEVRRLREVALACLARRERGSAVARPAERVRGLALRLGGVFVVRRRLIGRGVVRSDHVDDLELTRAEELLEMGGGPQVPDLPVAPREHLVRDNPDEILEEAVLAALGRARVALEREHLLADERGQQGFEQVSSASIGPVGR